jgi:hypothetical protein
MLLRARLLSDVTDVNHYDFADYVEANEGDAPTFYFQLVDDSVHQNIRPHGRRYMPPAGTTLSVTLQSIDDASTVTVVATQPFAQDPSIWSIALTAVQVTPGTRAMKLLLTEPGPKVTNGYVPQAVVVNPMAPEF